jgi:cytochrome P450
MLAIIPSSTLILTAISSLAIYYLCWIIYTLYFHPLHGYPGPLLARITTWHRWYSLRYQINANVQHGIHKKYGLFVRIAPDELQIADPDALETISKREFVKSEFYDNFDPKIGGNRIEVFAERNEARHNTLKKLLLPLFRQESIARYEHHVDHILQLFQDQIAQVAEGGETIDLAEWIAMLSWDTVGRMVYGYEDGLGMLKGKKQNLGWMDAVRIMQWQTGQLGYVPKLLRGPYFIWQLILSGETRKGLMGAMTVVKQIQSLIRERKEKEAVALAKGEDVDREDWVGRMLNMCSEEVKVEKGGEVEYKWNEGDMVMTLNAFVWAGSDTTGSVLGMVSQTPQFFTCIHSP